MREILISFQDEHQQIEQRISILEKEMDEKFKLKALNKDEEEKYKNKYMKLKKESSNIQEKIKEYLMIFRKRKATKRLEIHI